MRVIADPGAGRGDETLTRGGRCSPRCTRARSPSGSPSPAQPRAQAGRSSSFAEAACLPTAWLTAYRMLFVKARRRAGRHRARAGRRRWGRHRGDRARRRCRAAHVGHRPRGGEARPSRRARRGSGVRVGARLPDRVDAVLETVGEATWDHSLKALRPGGTLVVSGSTSGPMAVSDLRRVFFHQLSIVGSTMGTREELVALQHFWSPRAYVRRSTRPSCWPMRGTPSSASSPARRSARSSSSPDLTGAVTRA